MVVASFNHSLSFAHYEGFLPRRKEHKFKSGKDGAMLGVPFQSVKDGFFTHSDSSFLYAKARLGSSNRINFRRLFQAHSLLFVRHCGLSWLPS